MITGAVHSIETLGTLDGPGIRTVVFLQGCPLKCKFCHNIDCAIKDGPAKSYTVNELVETVIKNKPYWESHSEREESNNITGGVTISGGEPTFQPEFLLQLLKELKKRGIHTAIDTCLLSSPDVLRSLVPYVDLFMISIKHMDEKEHIEMTNSSNRHILSNILVIDDEIGRYKEKKKNIGNNPYEKSIRIRFLVIPDKTDSKEHIDALGTFIQRIKNIEQVEILGYGSHGKHKWEELFGKYDFAHVRDATRKDVQTVAERLKERFNLPVMY